MLFREERGGNTASQKATSIAAVGLFVLRVRVRVRVVTIVWVKLKPREGQTLKIKRKGNYKHAFPARLI